MNWAKDAREIVAEDGEVCKVDSLQDVRSLFDLFILRTGWLVGLWNGAKSPSWTLCPHKLELYLEERPCICTVARQLLEKAHPLSACS
jgi:hypothetical protein